MALTFLEAIVDVTKADIVAVAKLKSHSKVGYQDHPMGGRQCSVCAMFVPGTPPSCTHVAPPISANGWCEDFERHDRAASVRGHLEGMLGVKIGDDGSITAKAYDPGEARDQHGKWTDSGTSDGTEARSQRDAKQMAAAEAKVADLQRQLSEHSQDKSEDIYWGIHQSLQQARADLEGLKTRVFGKAFDPTEPRDEKGQWTAESGISAKDAMSLHGKVNSERLQGLADNVATAHDALADQAKIAKDAEDEADKVAGTDESDAAERDAIGEQMQAVASAVDLHESLSRLHDATGKALAGLESQMAAHGIARAA